MNLSQRLRELRRAKGYSITDLVQISGVSNAYVRQLESRIRTNPSGLVLQKLATALGTTVGDLVGSTFIASEECLHEVPKSLKDFVQKKGKSVGLRKEDIEMLQGIHFRGRRPRSVEDWELIFLFLKRILG